MLAPYCHPYEVNVTVCKCIFPYLTRKEIKLCEVNWAGPLVERLQLLKNAPAVQTQDPRSLAR